MSSVFPGGQPGGMIDLPGAGLAHQAVCNLLRHLQMLTGAPPAAEVAFYGTIRNLTAPGPGLFLPALAPGAACAEGQLLGTFAGAPLPAPSAGVVTTLSAPGYCFAGDRLTGVAPRR